MIADFGGLSKVMPRLAVFFMIITLSSIALPGTNGFVGEFLILLGAFRSNIGFGVLATSGVILGAVYMLWMFQRVMFGRVTKEENSRLTDLTKREALILCAVVLFVFLMGLSYVLINPTTVKALRLWFPANLRGTAMSLKQIGMTLGGATVAILLPTLSLKMGWRTGVAVVGFGLTIGTFIGYFLYRDPPNPVSRLGTQAIRLGDLKSVIKNFNLLLLSLMALVFGIIQFAITTHLVIYLVKTRAFSPIRAGACLLMVNIAGAIGRIVWGILSDRAFHGRRQPALMITGVTTALAAIVIGLFGSTMLTGFLYLILLLIGFTAYGWNGIFFAAVSELTDDRLLASGVGWSLTVAYIGNLGGPPLFGKLIDVTSSYGVTWTIFGIITGLSVLFLVPIREKRLLHA